MALESPFAASRIWRYMLRRIAERIESGKIVSHSQFNQGKTLEAGALLMRATIRMIVGQWGCSILGSLNSRMFWRVASRLGREEGRQHTTGRIERVMAKDEIDEHL